MDIETLQTIGLSTTEAKVYLALLELGSALAGEITKRSQINRTNVYDALERLIKKGLATYIIQANRKLFRPVNPERLREILVQKQTALDKILPQLKLKYNSCKDEQQATIFEGNKGIRSIFEDMLRNRKTFYIYGAQARFSDMFPSYQKQVNKRRAELGIKLKIIYSEKVRKTKQQEKLKLAQIKYSPKQYDFPSTMFIYSDKVVTISWTKQPYGFMIKSKQVVKSNLNFFNMLWNTAKP